MFQPRSFGQVGQWMLKPPSPEPRQGAAGEAVDARFYVIGGSSGNGASSVPLIYDVLTDTWEFGPPSSLERAYMAHGVINHRIYVAGGAINSDSNNPTAGLEIYDPVGNFWANGPPMQVARPAMASAVIGQRLYCAGGNKTFPYHAWDLLEIYDAQTNSWSFGAPMPLAVSGAAGATIDGKFYVVGGGSINERPPTDAVQIYDPATNSWSIGAPMRTPRYGLVVGVIDGKLVAAGGHDATGNHLTTAEIYDPISDSWSDAAPSQFPSSLGCSAVFGFRMFVAGGSPPSDILQVFTLGPGPGAITGNANAITPSGATLTGTVNPNGSTTTAIFQYGLTTSYGSSVPVSPAPGSGVTPVPVNAVIGGLDPNQSYHFRLVATNSFGTSPGANMTFTTSAIVPGASTGVATGVTNTGGTLNGTVNPNGANTTAVFEYGLTTSYGATVSVTPPPGSGRIPVNVSANVAGLEPNQTYHFRLRATNTAGTAFGTNGTFTTGSIAPSATTGPASNVTSTGATLGGTVNPNGSQTTATFDYGLDTTYGSSAPAVPVPGNGTAPVTVSAQLSGLQPARTYHYRLTATSVGGSASGTDSTFTTSPVLPFAQTLPATGVTRTTATLHGTVNPNGTATSGQFVVTADGQVVQQTPALSYGNGTSDVPVTVIVTGLEPVTDYEYRFVATNAAGTRQGESVAFRTAGAPLQAQDDRAFAVLRGTEFAIEVLENDEGEGLFISEVGAELPGRISINADKQSLNFTPSENNSSAESFTYRIRDLQNDPQNESQATVTVHYFLNLRGTYFCNLTLSGGRLLRLRVDLDFAGVASGRLEWEGQRYPFKVQFDSAGAARIAKTRTDQTLVSLEADLTLDPTARTIVGTFHDSGPTPTTHPIVLQLLPADPDGTLTHGTQIAFVDVGQEGSGSGLAGANGASVDRPEGIGFSRIRISKGGRARITTKMPDFAAFSVGKRLNNFDRLKLPHYPLETVPVKSAGKTVGDVRGDLFADKFGTGLEGVHAALTWQINATDLNLLALFEGFRYRLSETGRPTGFERTSDPNATFKMSGKILQDMGLANPTEFPIFINRGKAVASATVADAVARSMVLKLDLRNGFFKGSILMEPEGGAPEKVRIMGGMPGEVGLDSVLGTQDPDLRGSFFVKSLEKTGRVIIKPINP